MGLYADARPSRESQEWALLGNRAPIEASHRGIEPRQLAALFAYNLVIWTLGNGLLPLLPLYAETLGANDFVAGLYLAITYGALALGTFTAGWIHDHVGRSRVTLVASGVVSAPIISAVSGVGSLWLFVAMTATVWFLGGIGLSLTYILAGRSAELGRRGAVLGFLAMAAPFGSIIGGLAVGGMKGAWGYPGMWLVGGILWFLCPLAGLFVRDDDRTSWTAVATPHEGVPWASRAFVLLLAASLFVSVAYFLSVIGRSFAMRNFQPYEITSTVTVQGLVALPLTFLTGFLSDRLGRMGFLMLCYVGGLAGLLVYAGAATLESFWEASALMGFQAYASAGVASALVTDLVPRDALGRGMALYNATGWIGAVLGFVLGGALSRGFGITLTFLVGAALVGPALLLLIPVWYTIRVRRGGGTGIATPDDSRKA